MTIERHVDRAFELVSDCHAAYIAAAPGVRRALNQAFFERIFISDE